MVEFFSLSRGVFEWNRKWKCEKILRSETKRISSWITFNKKKRQSIKKSFSSFRSTYVRRSRKRYGKTVVCERESIKEKYCEKKLFLTAFHVSQILLATENYFWIQESFFVCLHLNESRAKHRAAQQCTKQTGRLFIRKRNHLIKGY